MEMYANEHMSQLNVSVTNMPKFYELLRRAKSEANQLQETLMELSFFNISFSFSANEETKENEKDETDSI